MTILVSIQREDQAIGTSYEDVMVDEHGRLYVAPVQFRMYETSFHQRILVDPAKIGSVLAGPKGAPEVHQYLETLNCKDGEWYPSLDTLESIRTDLDFGSDEDRELLFERVIGVWAGNLKAEGRAPQIIEQIVKNTRALILGRIV